MTIDDPFGLRPIWDATLDIYKEIARVCDRHGLRYYVTDGTLIGAIRHKGFIPWDDDFDMSMPRPDYEKFIECAKTELPPYLKFVNWKNTPEFHLMFGKIQDCRRELIEDIEGKVGHELSNGLFVDIFPIDGYPTGKWTAAKIRIFDFLCHQAEEFRKGSCRRRSWKGKLLQPISAVCSLLMHGFKTHADFQAVFERFLLESSFEASQYTGRASVRLHVLYRPPLFKSAWGQGRIADFCDVQIRVPDDLDAYMRPLYGDYMKLPPKDKQRPTHSYEDRCAWWLGPTAENGCKRAAS